MTTQHPDYALLAARIAVSNLHKQTKAKFSGFNNKLNRYNDISSSITYIYCDFLIFLETISDLYNWINPKTGKHSPMVSKQLVEIVMQYKEVFFLS